MRNIICDLLILMYARMSVCLSLFVGHIDEPCKTSRDAVWSVDSWNQVLILPTVPLLFFVGTDSRDFPDCLPIFLSISVFTF